ncbi:hypothetical protein AC578_1014 [Pseudocercospora eumusae]|uniref:JmjC domain-containing protein n=1 Tax=Pseudocercospora eumusae TaxID=321146 RepID=A0A139HTU2_9PEZI|nr:hypothetical protein AC578_1014 [Pseudocercospora eumusae]KXT05803.1 hypothetical protein AC578_1014 [Pseudocercospora eumusae]
MASPQEEVNDTLLAIAAYIQEALDSAVPNDTIHHAGLAHLRIIADRPRDVIDFAKEKLSTWPYTNVPLCWRRLFEDASLYLAIQQLKSMAAGSTANSNDNEAHQQSLTFAGCIDDASLAELVNTLDRAIIISGAPGRKAQFDSVFGYLYRLFAHTHPFEFRPQRLQIARPRALHILFPRVPRYDGPLDSEAFQLAIAPQTPFIMPGTFDHWPARKMWDDVQYLKDRSLNGQRLVPVEIGESYADAGWSQKLMPFGEFIDTYLLPQRTDAIGYLAQHDLFETLPGLKNDIDIPDYCYFDPPQPTGAAAQTAGLDSVRPLEQPIINAWLGPAGTKTPLHTDPYHNILCQVHGYKYVRLYSPYHRAKLYPHGTNEGGISMSNTSRVDIQPFVPPILTSRAETSAKNSAENKASRAVYRVLYPDFGAATYMEAILGPGECLYIPVGWFHYVESLTASFSVSFWFN